MSDLGTWDQLSKAEMVWRQLGPLLKSRGYLLRPRYHLDWKPPKKKIYGDERTLVEVRKQFRREVWKLTLGNRTA
jgi:hypothetical protein